MKRTAVYIATTEGPSKVQRITPEDCDVRSVICHDGKAIALPVSADYDSFVRRPTGVVEACFGHCAYRVDISDPIANGLSWQLGLFVAHALFDEGRLVGSDDKIPQIVWATGEVTRDLAVEPVDDVDRKIRQSESRIRAHLDGGSRVVLAVPVGNLTEADKALSNLFGDDYAGLHMVPAHTVCDVLAALGLKHRRRTRQWMARTSSAMGGRRKVPRQLAMAGSLALLAFAVVTGWQKYETRADPGMAKAQAVRVLPASLRPDPPPSLAAISIAVRPPEGKLCAAVHLDRVAPLITHRAVHGGTQATGLRGTDLCDFRYRLTNGSDRPAVLWALALRENATGGEFRLRPLHAEKPLAARATLDLDARPPSRLSAPLRQALVVMSVRSDGAAGPARLDGIWRQLLNASSSRDLDRFLKQARADGAAILRLTNEFRP